MKDFFFGVWYNEREEKIGIAISEKSGYSQTFYIPIFLWESLKEEADRIVKERRKAIRRKN